MGDYQRKVKELLQFYEKEQTEIKFRHASNSLLEIKGQVKKVSWIFSNPYAIVGKTKIFLEDIDLKSIMPSDLHTLPEFPQEPEKITIMVRTSLPPKLRYNVFKRDKNRCQYCGRSPPAVELEVDHRVPISKGGTDEMSNLRTSCFDCNRGKGADY